MGHKGRAKGPGGDHTWRHDGLVLVLVWFVFPPKVVLEWRVEGTTPQEFRVYRSVEAGSQNFTLVEEIPAAGSSTDYQFVDLQLIPGREYAYRIEAISSGGEPMTSELIRSDSSSALPSQMALLLTFSVSIYGLAIFLSEKMHLPAENLRFRMG